MYSYIYIYNYIYIYAYICYNIIYILHNMCICTVVYPMIYPQSQSLEHHAGIRRCSGSWTFRAPGCVWPQRRKHRPSRNKKLQRLITQLWGIGGDWLDSFWGIDGDWLDSFWWFNMIEHDPMKDWIYLSCLWCVWITRISDATRERNSQRTWRKLQSGDSTMAQSACEWF